MESNGKVTTTITISVNKQYLMKLILGQIPSNLILNCVVTIAVSHFIAVAFNSELPSLARCLKLKVTALQISYFEFYSLL